MIFPAWNGTPQNQSSSSNIEAFDHSRCVPEFCGKHHAAFIPSSNSQQSDFGYPLPGLRPATWSIGIKTSDYQKWALLTRSGGVWLDMLCLKAGSSGATSTRWVTTIPSLQCWRVTSIFSDNNVNLPILSVPLRHYIILWKEADLLPGLKPVSS